MDVSTLESLIEEQIEQRGEDSVRKAIRLSREQSGITQHDLAIAAGISPLALQQWEAERSRLSVRYQTGP